MKAHSLSPVSSPSPKPRQHPTREVSSRFLHSPSTSTESADSHSPLPRKSSSPADGRRHKIIDDPGITRHQLWPSSSATAKTIPGTLADHITEDRIIETKIDDKNRLSVTSSMRHTGRFVSISPLELESPSSSTKNANSKSSVSRRNSFSITNLESEYHNAGFVSPRTARKPENTDVKSRRAQRGASDSNIANLNSDDSDSSVLKKFVMKKAIKRANSLTGYKSSKSQWALSPGRSESPVTSVETVDKQRHVSVSALKRSTSPTMAKGVEKILNLGLDLFKSKKILNNSLTVGFGISESVYQLRLLDNRLIQWRFANARAIVVNRNISLQAENNLVCAWDSLTKLQYSVLRKKIQFAREKLEMKITFILYSQMKLLEAWGGMERQHVSAITATKECLHSVVCRVPLLEGAKVNTQSISIALQKAFDLTASIKSILTSFSPSVDTTAKMLSELAKVVAQEKQLLEEFHDLFQILSVFELQERSMKCNLVQLEGWQQKYQPQQLLPEMIS